MSRVATQQKSFIPQNGFDDLNLAELPIFYMGKTPPADLQVVSYEATLSERNKPYIRKVEISSGKKGLPTFKDGDVILALFAIAMQRQDKSPRVHFTRQQILEFLGRADNGPNYTRLEQSLERWIDTSFKYQNWIDPKSGQRGKKAFNILSGYEIYDSRRRSVQHELPLSYVEFTTDFWAVMTDKWFKHFDYATYRKLTSAPAKQAYRLLNKRLYQSDMLEIDLHTLACGHCGYSRKNSVSELKRCLNSALNQIADVGFIRHANDAERYVKIGKGEYRVLIEKQVEALPSTDDYPVQVHALIEAGMGEAEAIRINGSQDIQPERIDLQLEHLEWLQDETPDKAPANPGGWLRKAILEDYPTPKNFKSRAQREAETKRLAEQAKARKEQADKATRKRQLEAERTALANQQEEAAIQAYLDALPEDDREALIIEAIKALPIGSKEALAYHEGDEDIIAEAYYLTAIKNQVRPLLSTTACSS